MSKAPFSYTAEELLATFSKEEKLAHSRKLKDLHELIMTEERSTINLNEWFKALFEFYRGILKQKEPDLDVVTMIYAKLKEAVTPWPRAPKAFDKRIRLKTGFDKENPTESHFKNLKPGQYSQNLVKKNKERQGKIKEATDALKERAKEGGLVFTADVPYGTMRTENLLVRGALNKQEEDFLINCRKKYSEDFDLKNSADSAVLEQLIIAELMVFRLNEYSRMHPTANVTNQFKIAFEQILECQTTLRISRKERRLDEAKDYDSLQDLASIWERTIKEWDKIQYKDFAEELLVTTIKLKRNEIDLPIWRNCLNLPNDFSLEDAENWLKSHKDILGISLDDVYVDSLVPKDIDIEQLTKAMEKLKKQW
jgi:hypothetical protein